MKLAPILLFVYNRPRHTKDTIEALKKNILSCKSDLIIFSDAAKSNKDLEMVNNVRLLLKNIDGFKSVNVIKRDKNYGLAQNILDGVTQVIQEYGKAIVLEDDIVTSPVFLEFMNNALNFYEKEKKVWHISGWNYPIDPTGLEETFLWRTMNCWGWATWNDRWAHYQKDPERLITTWSEEKIKSFNLEDTHNFWSQVTLNYSQKINTWAIFWYATIFDNNGLCLNPTQSLVLNIGLDGSGKNCGTTNAYNSSIANKLPKTFPTDYLENSLALARVQNFYKRLKKPLHIRTINKASRLLLKRNVFS